METSKQLIDDSNSDSDEEPPDTLLCVACDKRFKSIKALENHAKSKKHKENLAQLKKALEEDELALEDDVQNSE